MQQMELFGEYPQKQNDPTVWITLPTEERSAVIRILVRLLDRMIRTEEKEAEDD